MIDIHHHPLVLRLRMDGFHIRRRQRTKRFCRRPEEVSVSVLLIEVVDGLTAIAEADVIHPHDLTVVEARREAVLELVLQPRSPRRWVVQDQVDVWNGDFSPEAGCA